MLMSTPQAFSTNVGWRETSTGSDAAGASPVRPLMWQGWAHFWCRNVARVLTINDMFLNATALNQNLGSWYGSSQVHNHHK